MLRCYEPAHIVGISKTAYGPATPRCLDWRHDRAAPTRRILVAGLVVGSRRSPRPRLPGAGLRRPRRPHRPSASVAVEHRRCRRQGRRRRARRRDRVRRRDPGVSPTSTPICSMRCAGGDRRRGRRRRVLVNSGWRSPEYQDQLLRDAVSKYGSEAEAARWVATPARPPTCRATRSTSGPRRHGVALRARRRVRAVPDLRQRALALRAAPRCGRPRLPGDVRRSHARPADAVVTSRAGRPRPPRSRRSGTPSPCARPSRSCT